MPILTDAEQRRDTERRLKALERRRQRKPSTPIPTDPTPLATETVAGKAQLADSWEAHLWPPSVQPGSNLTSTIMTPQRTMEMLEWFAPKVGMARTSARAEDWNDAIEVGFYQSSYDALNSPPGGDFNTTFLGLVHSGSNFDYNSGGDGFILQDLWEIRWVSGAPQVLKKWIRVRDNDTNFTWTLWAEAPGSGAGGSVAWVDITGKPTIFPTDWTSVSGKPTSFTPSAHTHPSSQITDFATAVPAAVPNATETVFGKVKFATAAEISAGASGVAVDPADVQAMISGGITPIPPASETVAGIVELATTAEATAGSDSTRAITAVGLKAVADTKAALVHTHTSSQITDFSTAADARVNTLVPAASQTAQGKIELATTTEVAAGTDAVRAVTPATLLARTATDARIGLVELATPAEAVTGTDTIRAVTPEGLTSAMNARQTISQQPIDATWASYPMGTSVFFSNNQPGWPSTYGVVQTTKAWSAGGGTVQFWTGYNTDAGRLLMRQWMYLSSAWTDWVEISTPQATSAVSGRVELATDAETQAGADATRAVTPAGLSSRTATETRTGILASATYWQAIRSEEAANLPDLDTPVIMTPARVKDALNFYAPEMGLGQTAATVLDWNLATDTGFYRSEYDALNVPPGDNFSTYMGIVLNGDSLDWGSGSGGTRIQHIFEYVNSDNSYVIRSWRRVQGYLGAWGTWESDEASETQRGIVELATSAETIAGTDALRAVTPAGLASLTALDSRRGLVELATSAETAAGTDNTRAVTPASLLGRTATATRTGLVELATPAEALTGTDTARAVTPQGLKGVADTKAALAHTHTSTQITDFASAVDARIASAQTLRIAGTSADRGSISSPPLGLVFYETDTRWEWIFDGSWRFTPGQVLASMVGPVPNTSGTGVINGVIISTPILPLGQMVKIIADFSQYNAGAAGISAVRTAWRNSATDVSFATNDGFVTSRAASPSSAAVVSGRGVNALFTTTAAAKVSAAIYTETASSGIYGADGTHLRIESA